MLDDIAAVDEAGGDGLADVGTVTVCLTDLADDERVDEAYGMRFDGTPPTKVCLDISRLPEDVRVEMDATAYLS